VGEVHGSVCGFRWVVLAVDASRRLVLPL
jgi:hypothetical protein